MSAKLPARKYTRPEITVTYQPRRCTHVTECLRRAPQVFNNWEQPWVRVENGTVAAIVKAVELCPTGALHYERTDGGAQEQPAPTNTVWVTPNGPYYVFGDFELVLPDGTVIAETRAALCRCGASQNKPFCDNSHRASGFRDAAIRAPTPSAETELPARTRLRITPEVNGSLRFEGPFQVRDAAGETIYRGQEEWLCRCGGSNNKPFCDSTHKSNGFKS
jgi:CDGSH-type Zn-finger protein/uncharacterized Fe-S cluster protein YjdI